MPAGGARADSGGPPKLGLWQRLLARAPRLRSAGDSARAPMGERIQRALLKPEDPAKGGAPGSQRPPTLGELEAARRSDDTERLVGLSLAPIAGLIAILISSHQLANNPPAPSPQHVSTTLTHELEAVLLALALVILVTSLARQRLYTGIATALYGLAVFNLHWWGFGFPFVFVGAWFMVRAYRAQQAYKAATEDGSAQTGRRGPAGTGRYTPPRASPRRPPSRRRKGPGGRDAR